MLKTLDHDLRARIADAQRIEEQLARICEKAAGEQGRFDLKLELYPIDDEMAAVDVLSGRQVHVACRGGGCPMLPAWHP